MNNPSQDSHDDLQQLAGEYVIGTLNAAQRREVEKRLQSEPALRAAIQDWEQRLLPLTELAAPQPLPPQLWQRIIRSIEPVTRAASRWIRWWNDLSLWRGLTAGSLVAAMLLCAILVTRPAGEAPVMMVVLVSPQEQTPGWVIQAGLDRQLTLKPLGSDRVPERKALQFWTKGDDWKGPVSLGLVQAGKATTVQLDHLPPMQPNQLFEITLEPENGSPIDRPTGPILYIGKAVKLI